MRKIFLFSSMFVFLLAFADKETVELTKDGKGKNRTEVLTEPQANYDNESNTLELLIEADTYFTMVVLDVFSTKVYSCPVLMVDGTPTNYQLPELPAGIYTLKVESPEVSYEGTLVIE